MEIKKSVRFQLMPRKIKDWQSGGKTTKTKNLLIVMNVTYCGLRIGMSTKLHIDKNLWDARFQRVTGGNLYIGMSEVEINYHLEMHRKIVNMVMYKYEDIHIIPTTEQFKKTFKEIKNSVLPEDPDFKKATAQHLNPYPGSMFIPPYLQPTALLIQQLQQQGFFQSRPLTQQSMFSENPYPFQNPYSQNKVTPENMENVRPQTSGNTINPSFNNNLEMPYLGPGIPQKSKLSDPKDDMEDGSILDMPIEADENDGKERNFWWALKEFVRVVGQQNEWTPSTYQKFDTMKNHLIKFRRIQRAKLRNMNFDLSFSYFDIDGLLSYMEYMSKIENMKNSTVDKQFDFLKWFLRWTLTKRYHDVNDFETFRPKLKKTQNKVVFLTKDELEKLRKFVAPDDRKNLERVRDVFLFQCRTGLRHSDVFNLRRCDVHDDYIDVTTVKTNDTLRIELNEQSKSILDRYRKYLFDKDKALPVISLQKMNDSLHELCRLAGIDERVRKTYYRGKERIDEIKPKWELVGTHTGRRTFICHALSMGIPAEVVMKWTGHSDYKAMRPYIDVVDEIKARSMKKFDNLFCSKRNGNLKKKQMDAEDFS